MVDGLGRRRHGQKHRKAYGTTDDMAFKGVKAYVVVVFMRGMVCITIMVPRAANGRWQAA